MSWYGSGACGSDCCRSGTGIIIPDGCVYFEDDFNRADGPVGSDWVIRTGSWSINNNALFSDEIDSEIRYDKPFSGIGAYFHRFFVKIQPNTEISYGAWDLSLPNPGFYSFLNIFTDTNRIEFCVGQVDFPDSQFNRACIADAAEIDDWYEISLNIIPIAGINEFRLYLEYTNPSGEYFQNSVILNIDFGIWGADGFGFQLISGVAHIDDYYHAYNVAQEDDQLDPPRTDCPDVPLICPFHWDNLDYNFPIRRDYITYDGNYDLVDGSFVPIDPVTWTVSPFDERLLLHRSRFTVTGGEGDIVRCGVCSVEFNSEGGALTLHEVTNSGATYDPVPAQVSLIDQATPGASLNIEICYLGALNDSGTTYYPFIASVFNSSWETILATVKDFNYSFLGGQIQPLTTGIGSSQLNSGEAKIDYKGISSTFVSDFDECPDCENIHFCEMCSNGIVGNYFSLYIESFDLCPELNDTIIILDWDFGKFGDRLYWGCSTWRASITLDCSGISRSFIFDLDFGNRFSAEPRVTVDVFVDGTNQYFYQSEPYDIRDNDCCNIQDLELNEAPLSFPGKMFLSSVDCGTEPGSIIPTSPRQDQTASEPTANKSSTPGLFPPQQSQTVDEPSVTQSSEYTTTSTLQPQIVGEPVASFGSISNAETGLQPQIVSEPTLNKSASTGVNSSVQLQVVDSPNIATKVVEPILVNPDQTQTVSEPLLITAGELTAITTIQSQSVDEPLLTKTIELDAVTATQPQITTEPEITVSYTGIADNCEQTQFCDSPTSSTEVDGNDCVQSQTCTIPDATYSVVLDGNNCVQPQTCTSPLLDQTFVYNLDANDCIQPQTCTSPLLTKTVIYNLDANDCVQPQTCDSPTATYEFDLDSNDCVQPQVVSEPSLSFIQTCAIYSDTFETWTVGQEPGNPWIVSGPGTGLIESDGNQYWAARSPKSAEANLTPAYNGQWVKVLIRKAGILDSEARVVYPVDGISGSELGVRLSFIPPQVRFAIWFGSSELQFTPFLDQSGWIDVRFCYNYRPGLESTILAYIDTNVEIATLEHTFGAASSPGQIGRNIVLYSTGTGHDFDDFEWRYSDENNGLIPGCDPCPVPQPVECDACIDGDAPNSFTVGITNSTQGDCECCDSLRTLFPAQDPTNKCLYTDSWDYGGSCVCDPDDEQEEGLDLQGNLLFESLGPTSYQVTYTLTLTTDFGRSQTVLFSHSQSTPYDCENINGLNLNFDNQSGDPLCDFTGSTARIN